MKRFTGLLVAFGAILGVVAGMLTSKPAFASTAFDLYMQPGGDASYMTCGWHGTKTVWPSRRP